MNETKDVSVLGGRTVMKADLNFSGPYTEAPKPTLVEDINEANIVISKKDLNDRGDLAPHYPVIDMDVPCSLVPSSTPGHFHLYIDREVTEGAYFNLLIALSEAGLVEEGYVNASFARGYTAVRLPWVNKETAQKELLDGDGNPSPL